MKKVECKFDHIWSGKFKKLTKKQAAILKAYKSLDNIRNKAIDAKTGVKS